MIDSMSTLEEAKKPKILRYSCCSSKGAPTIEYGDMDFVIDVIGTGDGHYTVPQQPSLLQAQAFISKSGVCQQIHAGLHELIIHRLIDTVVANMPIHSTWPDNFRCGQIILDSQKVLMARIWHDRTSISQLSSLLGYKFIDAYIGLTANQKLQTELYILSHLLKDRVRPEDLWRLVGECCIEAKQEETLGRHQINCHATYWGRHVDVERFLLEERKKWCDMEISLYLQAIGILEQLWMPHIRVPAKHEIRTPSATLKHAAAFLPCVPLPCAPLACSIEEWRILQHGCGTFQQFLYILYFPSGKHSSPSLPLLSTWITVKIQEAFFNAFQMELHMQVELMRKFVAAKRSNAYLRNLGLDLLILQAKMRCAKAEIQLYMLAIQNTSESGSSDHTDAVAGLRTSWDQSIPQPLSSEELNCHDKDIDDGMMDCDNDGTDDCDENDTDDDHTDDDHTDDDHTDDDHTDDDHTDDDHTDDDHTEVCSH
ncbi:hypothetical protein EDD22DRAFT_852209 [Suillus occidentalis]|nr:hypothetical protein EDD22DRAFT_852209 [Suillus occidentalis]